MTKAEIVAQIAQKTGIEKVAIQATVEEFMNVVKESLAEGENVYLRGFGSFIIKKRAEKTGRNISKNTTIIIPAHKNTKDTRCLLMSVKNVCARIDIRRSSNCCFQSKNQSNI